MVDSTDQEKARQPADRAGEQHGADNHALHFDADIAGSTLALADYGEFKAVLGVV